jgi:hypothetical protein
MRKFFMCVYPFSSFVVLTTFMQRFETFNNQPVQAQDSMPRMPRKSRRAGAPRTMLGNGRSFSIACQFARCHSAAVDHRVGNFVAFVADPNPVEIALTLDAEFTIAIRLAGIGAVGPAIDEEYCPLATIRLGNHHGGRATALARDAIMTLPQSKLPLPPRVAAAEAAVS